jgi:4-coumarate--CoA ligase
MPWLATDRHPLPKEDLLTWAFDHRTYDPDKPIYHDLDNPERTISWRTGRSTVRKLIAGFRAAGLKPGDCVSITSFNDIMYSMLFLGLVGAGGIFSGTNPAYKPYEVRHHIRTAQVKFFIVEPELLENILSTALSEGIPKERIFIFNTRPEQVVPEGFRSWEWLLTHGEEDWIRITDLETLKTTEIARLTTSGTTGLPKTAMQSHHNATSWHTMMLETSPPPWEPRNLYPLPQFHVATVPLVHASPFRSGNPCWIMRRFELELFLSTIERHQINYLGIVPPLVIAIIMSPLRHKYSLRSIRRVGCGAAPLDAGSQKRFQELCAPDAAFTQVMGMTETTGAISLFYYPETDDTGSVGSRFMANTDVKLINDRGDDVTDLDVRGELCVRGPTVIRGYFGNEKANAESWDSEGYFKTGDIMYCDRQSRKWYIVDRKKELIKVRGFQVAPPELEAVLLANEDIVDCAVIGVKLNPKTDNESPRAYVVRREGASMTEDAVKALISERLASYKALSGGVVFVNEIPKSASGKILKRVLREEAEKEMKLQPML